MASRQDFFSYNFLIHFHVMGSYSPPSPPAGKAMHQLLGNLLPCPSMFVRNSPPKHFSELMYIMIMTMSLDNIPQVSHEPCQKSICTNKNLQPRYILTEREQFDTFKILHCKYHDIIQKCTLAELNWLTPQIPAPQEFECSVVYSEASAAVVSKSNGPKTIWILFCFKQAQLYLFQISVIFYHILLRLLLCKRFIRIYLNINS